MAPNQTQRPQFYEGQYLGAEDLQALTEYYRAGDARHALGAHTWGIATGLQVKEQKTPEGSEIYVTPGYAWDGFGRPVVVLAPYKVTPELFKAIPFDSSLDNGTPEGRLVKLWIQYDESATRRPSPGFEVCTTDDQFSRIQETFRLAIGEKSTILAREDKLSVSGYSLHAQDVPGKFIPGSPLLYDESVPFQDFPQKGKPSRWLIPLGYIRWKPNPSINVPGYFVEREASDLTESRQQRQHIGVVAETVYPVDDVVRVRHRGIDPSPKRWSKDVLWTEGDLRIDGKLNLCDPTAGIHKWQIDGTTSDLSVREAASPQPNDRLVIKSGGNIGIGTTTPRGRLEIAGSKEQGGTVLFVPHQDKGTRVSHVHWDPTGDWYIRSAASDGKVVIQDGGGRVGIGTTTPSDLLDVNGDIRAGKLTVGPWPANNKYVFFGTNALDQANAANYALLQGADDNKGVTYLNSPEDIRLRIQNGDQMIVAHNGNVGIGTTNPTLKLDVKGDLGRIDGASTLHLWGSEIGDVGGGALFLKSGGGVVTFNGDDKVGVGLSAPQSRLHVVDDINGDAGFLSSHVATIENRSLGDNADVLALKVGKLSPGAANNFITFFGGNQVVGQIEGTGSGILIKSGGADFAECLPSVEEGEEIEAADVVGVYAGKITKRTQDADHVLAVSSRPLIVGCAPPKEREHLYQAVALLGQVPVKVRGPVGEGDYIVPSGLNDGTGKAVKPAEASLSDIHVIVGRAWESSDEQDVKLIKTAVGIPSLAPMTAALSSLQRQHEEMRRMQQDIVFLKSHFIHEEKFS